MCSWFNYMLNYFPYLSLAYVHIKDAINKNLAHKEQQAVNKVKDNLIYKQKHYIFS